MAMAPAPEAAGPRFEPPLSATGALTRDGAASLRNPGFAEASSRILIVRLSPWKDVDRSQAHLFLFSEARAALPRAFIDFSFFPDRADRDRLARGSRGSDAPAPFFFGISSGRSVADFDLVLVSNAFGLELVNLPWLFATAGLPFRASARRGLARCPIFILGGSNASGAGAIVRGDGDSFVDGIFFGEGEGAAGRLCALLAEGGGGRDERLARAVDEVGGFWASSLPERPTAIRRLRTSPPPLVDPPLLNSANSGTVRLQISAGCPGLCSFCFEGWDRRPYRELPEEELLSAARALKRNTGADSLEVYSFNFNTHGRIGSLIFELGRIFRRVNLMSQRLDILAGVPGLIEAELAGDKRSFTLGVEGVSRRMRAYYRKGIDDEELERLMALLVRPGIKELKLFYIISGLEEDSDLEEFAAFARRLDALRREHAQGLRVLASAGYLVRLPRTPLQYAPLCLDRGRLEDIAKTMAAACEGNGLEFRLAADFGEYATDQLLGLAGSALADWLETLPGCGFTYDGTLSRGAWPSLADFARSRGFMDAAFLGEKGEGWRPPLGFLADDDAVLRHEYLEARSRHDREACLGEGCRGCGACPDGEAMAAIGNHRIDQPDRDLIERTERLTAAKAAFKPVFAAVGIPEELAGATEAFLGAWLMRRLMATTPGSELILFEARECLFSGREEWGLPEGFIGRTAFALYGPRQERLRELCALSGLEALPARPEPASIRAEIVLPFTRSAARDDAAAEAIRLWLSSGFASFTERALPSGRSFAIAPKDRKKGRFLDVSCRIEENLTRISLELGPRADLGRLVADLRHRGRPARVRILDWSSGGQAG